LIGGAILIIGLVVLATTTPGSGTAGVHGSATIPEFSNTTELTLDHNSSGEEATQLNFAPDISGTTLNGEQITLSDYRGEKPVVIAFWASWCHNCQRHMPVLQSYYEEYGDDFEIFGVNLNESTNAAESFIDKHSITFPTIIDKGRISQTYNIRYTNTHILISKEGELLQIVPGDLKESDITNLIGS